MKGDIMNAERMGEIALALLKAYVHMDEFTGEIGIPMGTRPCLIDDMGKISSITGIPREEIVEFASTMKRQVAQENQAWNNICSQAEPW